MQVICKYCAILYKGLQHLKIWVAEGGLGTNPPTDTVGSLWQEGGTGKVLPALRYVADSPILRIKKENI